MNSNDSFQIIEGLKLIVVVHKNIITINSISQIIQEVLHNPYFKSDYSVIIDIRNANIKMSSDEIEETSKFVFDQLHHIDLKKLAIIATMAQTKKAVEFVRFYRESSKYQVFTSMEAALHWLKIPIIRKSQIALRLHWMAQQKMTM